jgi:hypothetical protein
MNDLPTIEKTLPCSPVIVSFASANPGTITFPANTAGATCEAVDGLTARVTPAGPTNYGHVDVLLTDGNGELGRARVIFLVPVTFS